MIWLRKTGATNAVLKKVDTVDDNLRKTFA